MMLLFTFCVLINICINSNPEELMTTMEMAEYWGYPVEGHVVTTVDGYVLKIYRVPGKQGESLEVAKAKKRPPVILQHGLICSSDQFLDAGALSIVYAMADAGYDVWIPNIRGNRYSRDHLFLDYDDNNYWNYTFEDMALKDQKTYWEYIMKTTGYEKLGFVAHSQGTTQMFIALIYDPDYYVKHLAAFIAQSPVADLTHTRSKPLSMSASIDLPALADKYGIHVMFPYKSMMAGAYAKVCTIVPLLCNFAIEMIADDEPNYDSKERMPVLMSHYPSGSGSKNYEHIVQLVKYGFVRYRNNDSVPLEYYDLSKMPKSINIALMVGSSDKLATEVDSRNLRDKMIANGQLTFYKEYPHMGHLTFLLPTVATMDYVVDTLAFLKTYYTPGRK